MSYSWSRRWRYEVKATVICRVRIAAAHDGTAELVVTLRHGNGGMSDVTLDEAASAALFNACGATHPEDLEGHGWERVKEALWVSSNRFGSSR
jgi:hypothetical protein